MKLRLAQWAESLSLTVFVVYIHSVSLTPGSAWLKPYLVASLIGGVISLYRVWRNWPLNRLFLGVNLYFLSGLIALILPWHLLNHIYAQQGAAAMLAWILIVGLWTTLRSPIGMLGVPEGHFRSGSWCLLAVCLMALLAAYQFKGSMLWGEWMPFVVLFTTRSVCCSVAFKTEGAKSRLS